MDNDPDRIYNVTNFIYSRLHAQTVTLKKIISCCISDYAAVLPSSGNVFSYKQFLANKVNYSPLLKEAMAAQLHICCNVSETSKPGWCRAF